MRSELIRIRRMFGLSQADVAKAMGVTQQAVYKIERYDSDPKLSTLRRYANAVGAIVEHRVTPDVGQSIALASKSTWEDVELAIPFYACDRTNSVVSHVSVSGSWSAPKSTEYALSA